MEKLQQLYLEIGLEDEVIPEPLENTTLEDLKDYNISEDNCLFDVQ